MKELNTPFGTLYIDSWNPRERPAENRITIYDSRKDFLDYFVLEYFYDGIDDDSYAENEYNKLCEMLEKGGETRSVKQFMDWLGVNFSYAGKSKLQAAKALSNGHPEELLPNELETNEYVNHIGDNYIVVADC